MSLSVQNLLPHDGEVFYIPNAFNKTEATYHFRELLSALDWQPDNFLMFGKRITTKRKVAWYGNEPFSYTYAQATKTALPWTRELEMIKEGVEKISATSYNSCLANLYHDGSEAMGWHSDNEKELLENGAIASVSFGAERKFHLKHNETKEKVSLVLEAGSLLLMKGIIQKKWKHQLPASKKVLSPRINLTFRTIVKS